MFMDFIAWLIHIGLIIGGWYIGLWIWKSITSTFPPRKTKVSFSCLTCNQMVYWSDDKSPDAIEMGILVMEEHINVEHHNQEK